MRHANPLQVPWRILRGRPFLSCTVILGMIVDVMLPAGLARLTRGIVAWDAGGIALLVLYIGLFSAARPEQMARDAERQQAGEWTIFWMTVLGAAASFAAIVGEFSNIKDMPAHVRQMHVGLVTVTLLISWLVTHALFAIRYAHEYYERLPDGSGLCRGLDFPSDDEPDYWDFMYFAIVLGMTFQVSDVQITARKLRRLAMVHGMLGFLFNTVILALTINIAAGLL